MKVLLLGYFGQDNFGDEAINRATMRFLLNEFPNDLEVNLCNQAAPTTNLIGKFEENCEGLSKFSIKEVWFDSITYNKYDLVVICNSGFVYGFCVDVALEAVDKGIPLKIYSLKQGNPGGLRGEILNKIMDKSDFAITRSENHFKTFNSKKVINGIDLAYFNQDIKYDNSDYILIAPRFYNDEINEKQINYIHKIVNEHSNEQFNIFNSSIVDKKLNQNFWHIKNINIMDCNNTNVNEQIKMIASAKSIISLGRFHPLLFALKYNIPALYVKCGDYQRHHYNMNKVELLCDEYGIQMVQYPNYVDDIIHHYNPILNDRVKNTLKAINIEVSF